MKLSANIRRMRKEKGLTQEQVAQALGVTAPAVNKWERGASCPDLALLADGPGEAPVLARRLRVCRNIDAVLQIAVALLSILPLPAEEAWVQLPAVLLLLFWLWTRVVIAVSLFVLRGFFPLEET